MVIKQSGVVQNPQPFKSIDPTEVKSFNEYKESAIQNLIQTVKSYKADLGKPIVDEMQLLPGKFRELIWFIFP